MFAELPAWGIYIRHVADLELKSVTLKLRNKDFRKAIVLDDVSNARFYNLRFPGYKLSDPIYQNASQEIYIDN